MPSKIFTISLACSLVFHFAASAPFFVSSLSSKDHSIEIALIETKRALPKSKPAQAVPAIKPELSAHKPKPKKALSSALLKQSADLLKDPIKGKIFSRYFLRIKEKINQTVQDRYLLQKIGPGKVALIFILAKDGSLLDTYILDKDTQASAEARAFAVECIKKSVPFDSFPRDLGAERICFNINLVF